MKYMDFLKGCSKKSLFLESEEITHYATDYTKNLRLVLFPSPSDATVLAHLLWPVADLSLHIPLGHGPNPPSRDLSLASPSSASDLAVAVPCSVVASSRPPLVMVVLRSPSLDCGRTAPALTWPWTHLARSWPRLCALLARSWPQAKRKTKVAPDHFFPFWTLDIFYDYMSPY
jgi:hypothetical protein